MSICGDTKSSQTMLLTGTFLYNEMHSGTRKLSHCRMCTLSALPSASFLNLSALP
jgi:hypothetical protein